MQELSPFEDDNLPEIDRAIASAFFARERSIYSQSETIHVNRRITGQALHDALARKMNDGGNSGMLRTAMRPWVASFIQARIGLSDEARWREAATEHYPHGLPLEQPTADYRDAWRRMLSATSRNEASLWLEVIVQRGPALASIARRRHERRIEVARRLGKDYPSPAFGGDMALRFDSARALLDRTEDLARSFWHASSRAGEWSPVDAILKALARDASDGWPAQLTTRWLNEHLGAFAQGLRIELSTLPTVQGASSYGRAMGQFGMALASAAVRTAKQFSIGCEPSLARSHSQRILFGGLITSRTFQMRALNVGRGVADAQVRALQYTQLFAARLEAVRFLLTQDIAPPTSALFEELSSRLFGRPLPAPLCGAWPTYREDGAGRIDAVTTSSVRLRAIVNRFDEDWFRNPRAIASIRGPLSEPLPRYFDPSTDDDLPSTSGILDLSRSFEDALA